METSFSKGQRDLVVGDIKNILVNLTPTKDWGRVADFAIRHARRLGARLYFIDVIHDPFGIPDGTCRCPRLRKSISRLSQ